MLEVAHSSTSCLAALCAAPEAAWPVYLSPIANFWKAFVLLVGRPGLDPGTLGLKVPCSSR